MPNAIVVKLLDRVADLEKKVAVLLSWHKVQVGILSVVLAAVLALLIAMARRPRGIFVSNATAGNNAVRFIPGTTNYEIEALSGRGAVANSAVSNSQVFISGFYFI